MVWNFLAIVAFGTKGMIRPGIEGPRLVFLQLL